ncbi:TetR/AcrR family transcriptional regulator [Herminiimonas arsenitoxidans]|uniref:TetR/AcrR family transcriptional regulator n=1 Tax=Herminiimonas arsenitoxidans TaxID=1809410 RepID=UPI0009711402|nr:TetR/AcrR family transcriptional regulator [Herminiimonas arsenitoxidans]
MNIEVTKNKQGQTLGRKGQETRTKLMEATRQLLSIQSPVELTAVSIAAAAGTSPASFYMYFDDTKDILFALSEIAGEDMAAIHSIFDEPWSAENIEGQMIKVVNSVNEVWSNHREVLQFRNMEADRGDPRFEELRMNTYVPFIERFAQRIMAFNPAQGTRRRADIYAEATILHAAMERLAATEPSVMEKGLGLKRITNNLARIAALVLSSGIPLEVLEPVKAIPITRAKAKPR